jgi:hypothetical protein
MQFLLSFINIYWKAHGFFPILLRKLQVIQKHPVIKYMQYRLSGQMDETEEMCPRTMACLYYD